MNKIKFLAAFAALGMAFTSCNNEIDDTTGIGGGNNNGEKSVISLTINDQSSVTRAATGEETASSGESKIDKTKGLKIFVFNENGSLDYSNAVLEFEGSTDKTKAFEVTAGYKYFFVFANDGVANNIIAPTSTTTMENFLAQAISVVRDGKTTEISKVDNFLIGTLWKEKVLAQGGGTVDSPKNISLNIGRLISKVKLSNVAETTNNNKLAGMFKSPQYRIGSLPKKINTVGIHEGDKLPFGDNNKNVLVKSYVHDAAPLSATNLNDFYRYSSDNFIAVKDSLYTTENTTDRETNTGLQYYGNTTYIQVETVYEPGENEVYNPNTLTALPSFTPGTTFYTAKLISTGERLIFDREPVEGQAKADIDLSTIQMYEDGKNYHKFVIFDDTEDDDVIRNRVLRGHYYEFGITNFLDLGSPTKEVDPQEPVVTKTTVNVEVKVKPWNKVTNNNVEV